MAIRKQGPALRYAKALFELSVEQKQVSVVAQAAAALKEEIRSSVEFSEFLTNAALSRAEKEAVLVSVLKEMKAPKLLNDTVLFMAQKGRSACLVDVLEAFFELQNQAEGRVVVKVESATALTDGQRGALSDVLKSTTGAKDVVLNVDENEDLIGGMVLQIGSDEFDASLKGQLNKLHRNLRAAM